MTMTSDNENVTNIDKNHYKDCHDDNDHKNTVSSY